ncbi:MAG: TonB-dependent receptor, partial [Steroidobacteraceae bacterium]
SMAAFFDSLYSITDTVRIGGGVRLTHDKRSMTHVITPPTAVITRNDFSESWTEPTGRAVIEWKAADQLFVYGSYNRGYKAGGYDTFARSPLGLGVINPETVDSFEVGFKSDWWNKRLRLNVAGFRTNIKDYQLSALVDPVLVISRATNAGDIQSTGFEAELSVRPTEWFGINAAYGDTDSKFDSDIIIDAAGTNLNGLYVPRTPKETYGLGVDFRVPVGGGTLDGSASYTHRDEVFGEANNNLMQLIPRTNVLDANVGWLSSSGRWELRLWGRNLTDEDIILQIAAAGGAPSAVYAPPRSYGVTATLRN